ncbi:unnamed protein product [Polarella glacialis]|uniref:Uncharacterized protein n=1 Tax=Polarella glacialis TaxID=89957 RepID=A0A813G0V5_POLGL|nr:unnamed protein product [Polarella glacialis]
MVAEVSSCARDVAPSIEEDGASATNRTYSPSATLATFLVPKLQHLPLAFERNVHPCIRNNLASVVLLSNGFSCAELQPFAETLGCKVVVVITYGIIGWSTESNDNVEFEEKARGQEFGLPGSRHQLPGIIVVALKKQVKDDIRKSPVLTTDDEHTPTLAEGAAAHIVMSPFSNQPAAENLIFSDEHAACMGGYCKEIYELKGELWEPRTLTAITLIKSELSLVNLFNSYGAYEKDPLLAIATEGKIVAETLPDGFRPIFVVSYQCYCRGTNLFPTANMEARGLEDVWGKLLPTFGMFCAGEIGNDFEMNPCGWNSEHTAKQVTCLHSCNTIVCVVAERYDTNATIPKDLQSRQTLMAERMREAAAAAIKKEAPMPSEMVLVAYKSMSKDYKDELRGMNFFDVAVPNHNGVAFWTQPGGIPGPERYAKSTACRELDFFVSHVLRADPTRRTK